MEGQTTFVQIQEEILKSLYMSEDKLFKAKIAIQSLVTTLAIERTKSGEGEVLSSEINSIFNDFRLNEIML